MGIPLRLLPLRVTVYRFDNASGEYDNKVYENLPGRIALHRDSYSRDQAHVTSETEYTLFICNYEFEGNVVDLRFEDRIVIGTHKYRVLKVSNAESANHHFECQVEQVKRLSTPA